MKTVRYTGPATPPIEIPAAGVVSDEHGVAQVPDDVAESLLAQDVWAAGGGKAPTVAEVLADVDGDPVKATAALTAEQAADKPRQKLVDALTEIVSAPADDEPTNDPASEED